MRNVIYLALILLLSFSCANKEKNLPTNFDYGRIEGEVYKNNFFGIRVPVYREWHVQPQNRLDDLVELGIDEFVGNDSKLEREFDASLINLAQLLMVFKYELGSVNEFNPSFILNAENLKNFPEVESIEDYFVQAKAMLDRGQLDIEYLGDVYEKLIGNQKFLAMHIMNNSYNINQDYFVTLKNGFAVAIILSYDNEDDKEALYDVIENIKINKN